MALASGQARNSYSQTFIINCENLGVVMEITKEFSHLSEGIPLRWTIPNFTQTSDDRLREGSCTWYKKEFNLINYMIICYVIYFKTTLF